MQRLMAYPKGHRGLEEILERWDAELTERLRQGSSPGGQKNSNGHGTSTSNEGPRLTLREAQKLAGQGELHLGRRNPFGGPEGRISGGVVAGAEVEPPWIDQVTGRRYTPGRREAG